MSDPIARYAIVELMGHRRLGARVDEVEFCGAKMLQLTVLVPEPFVQLVTPASLYAVTFCTEEQARKVNTAWTTPDEMRPRLGAGSVLEHVEDDDEPVSAVNRQPEGPDPLDEGDDGTCERCGAGPCESCVPGCPVGYQHPEEG